MQCVLFASLCGSFAKNARYSVIGDSNSSTFRYVDDSPPSIRLESLARYFRQRPLLETMEWEDLHRAVDVACQQLCGNSIVDEIEADIEADKEYIRQYRSQMAEMCKV